MLSPKRTKYRKVQKGILKGKAQRGTQVTDGEYGIQALEPAWITANQIESVRVTISRYTKKVGKSWIKIFPDKPITKHPAESRMGTLTLLLASEAPRQAGGSHNLLSE